MMTSIPWIQSGWGKVLSAHRISCHWEERTEESWKKMVVRDNFCTSLHPRSPKIGLCHLSIRAPGSRLSSTNPALKSGGVWAKSIFQWSPCDVPFQSWMPILSHPKVRSQLSSSSCSLTSYTLCRRSGLNPSSLVTRIFFHEPSSVSLICRGMIVPLIFV